MLLELDNVKTYYGNIRALKGISIEVDEGEIVCLIGGNGAGKSTTLMTISGVLTPRPNIQPAAGSWPDRPERRVTMGIVLYLLIGAVAGWLAGLIMKGRGFGIFGNMIVGIIGGFIGGFLFRVLGLASTSFIGSLVTALVGAIVLLFIVGLVKKS